MINKRTSLVKGIIVRSYMPDITSYGKGSEVNETPNFFQVLIGVKTVRNPGVRNNHFVSSWIKTMISDGVTTKSFAAIHKLKNAFHQHSED